MIGFLIKLIISFASCLGTIFAFLAFFGETNTYKELLIKIGYPNGLPLEIKLLCFGALFLLVSIWQLCVYIKNAQENAEKSEELHFFFHHLRDETFQLGIQNDSQQYNSHNEYYKMVKTACYKFCDKIYLYLQKKCNKDFSVCIKMLEVESSYNGKPDTIELLTLCRAGKNHEKRSTNDRASKKVFASENTDFDTLLNNDEYNKSNTIFACSNLLMLKILGKIFKKMEYRNSSKDFWKQYLSTIVVPIRIDKEFLPEEFEPNIIDGYQTVAFLCIDYRWPLSKALKNELTGYVKGFGDSLYFLFHQIIIGDRKISKTTKEYGQQ